MHSSSSPILIGLILAKHLEERLEGKISEIEFRASLVMLCYEIQAGKTCRKNM
jgi:hypothetical protein